MKRILATGIGLFLLTCFANTQATGDSSRLILLNQEIDNYVMKKDLAALDTLYAPDLVFSHGTGLVEGKAGWLKTVANGNYLMRRHDSMRVEMHIGIGIVKGKMDNRRVNPDGKALTYHLRYLRVYALRKESWQLISHTTTWELDDM